MLFGLVKFVLISLDSKQNVKACVWDTEMKMNQAMEIHNWNSGLGCWPGTNKPRFHRLYYMKYKVRDPRVLGSNTNTVAIDQRQQHSSPWAISALNICFCLPSKNVQMFVRNPDSSVLLKTKLHDDHGPTPE